MNYGLSKVLKREKKALIRKLRRSLMCLAYFFEMSFKGDWTTRQWQTPGRLVQALNVFTVHV